MLTSEQKKVAKQIWEEIGKTKKILLHCHPSPDPDSVGSVLAMMWMLRGLGKEVTVIAGDSEKPLSMSCLPGFEKIVQKNYLEIDASDFDLFLVLDSSSPNQVSKKGEVIFPVGMMTVVIDHHAQDQNFGKVNLVDTNYPAIAQMLFDLFKEWNVSLTKEIAVCLMLGLYGDTGGFKYPRTTEETFRTAAELARINSDFPEAIFFYENNNQPQNIQFLGLALVSINLYFGDQVAIAEVPFEKLAEHGIEKKYTQQAEIANYLKSVVGWNIGINMVETEPGVVGVNLRTREPGKYDLSLLARALGGGGHRAAAGAPIYKTFSEAKEYLLEMITKVYPELGKP